MASKTVYFFELQLFHHDEMIGYQEFKAILQRIIDEHATVCKGYKSLDVTPYEDLMHIILDTYDYEETSFFVRMSKQKPSNSIVQRDYSTHEKKDILPGNDERKEGIEQYTYGYLNYRLGVFALASRQGAPNEKAISNMLELYAPEYSVKFISIPNARAIESIYEGKESEITKLEIEVPLPDLATLEKVFKWDEDEILEILDERNLSVSVAIKSMRRQSITRNQEETKKIMDAIKSKLSGYKKAKMKAKDQNTKLREYNFFEDKFSYPIDVQDSYTRNGERIYYTVDELVDEYKRRLRAAYYENERLLRVILDR